MLPPRDLEQAPDAAVDRKSANASTRAHSPASLSSEEREWTGELPHESSAPPGSQYDSPKPPGWKRRRITRACDDCRRKKIKCDGKTPCTSCAEFNSACTYNRPSNRARHAESRDVDALRKRLHRAESLLREFMPHLDTENNPGHQGRSSQQSPATLAGDQGDAAGSETAGDSVNTPDAPSDSARFIPLVERIGQLDLTDSGEYVFHGLSSGAAFLSRITQQVPALFGYDSRTPFLPQPPRPFLASPLGGLPVYSASPWWQANYDYLRLPSRDLGRALCEYSFSRASCILRVVHAPSFWKMFDKLFNERPQRYTQEERRFVGLLFSVIALGSMYDVDENDPTNPDHYAVAMDRGHKYYISARLYLQDITECCDMTTLQALVFMVQFLQATGNLSGCHTLVGIALRSALRMGLHRNLPHTAMTPIQDETRRRVFHVIRQMDIYLCTTLGLPLLLRDKDVDQPWPTEVDDEYITENAIVRPPHGTHSFLEAFNAHTRLMRILAKVVEHLYPPKGMDSGRTNVTYMISCARIREIEKDLHDWHENLPTIWRPGPDEDTQITRVKILLRFAYGHVQLMLYRPFLQFYARTESEEETADERHLAFATAGINVCRNIIHIGLEIRKQAVLIGPYWFITYTQFLAVLSVVLYVLHNPDKPETPALFSDAKLGKECISELTQRSLAADRITAALNSLFDQLPGQPRSTDSSTGSRAMDRNARPIPGERQAQHTVRPGHRAQQDHPMSTFGPRGQWPDVSSSGRLMVPPRGGQPLQSVPMSQPIHNRELADVMGFPLGDPFAYPMLPGVSLADNSFTALHEDVMRLPLHNMHTDMEDQLRYLQDSPLVSPMTSMPPQASESRFAAQHPMFRSLGNLDDGLFGEPPGPYGLPPF